MTSVRQIAARMLEEERQRNAVRQAAIDAALAQPPAPRVTKENWNHWHRHGWIVCPTKWVGGMFFAYMALRQSVGPLEPAVRLALWHRVFRRFFPWVWVSIVLLVLSGYGMLFLYFGGFAGAGLHIHLMQGTGIVMMLLFLHLFFVPWRRFGQALASEAFPKPPRSLIRSAASSRSISCSAS